MTGLAVTVLERVSRVAVLGLRLRDVAADRLADGALAVTARPADDPSAGPRSARRTRSGIWAFGALPGLGAVERGEVDPWAEPQPSPPLPRRRFHVLVEDPSAALLPVAFALDLPLAARGAFPQGAAGPASLPLHPAPARRAPPGMVVVRGTLARAVDGAPAAHAVIVATDPDGSEWSGMADGAGRFALFMAEPALADPPTASPGLGTAEPVGARRWTVRLSAFHGPLASLPLADRPDLSLPDLADALDQPVVAVWADPPGEGGSAAPDWAGTLGPGETLVPRTRGRTTLLIGPG